MKYRFFERAKCAEKENSMDTFKKNGVLALAHGKMMDSEKCMTIAANMFCIFAVHPVDAHPIRS